MRNRKPRTIAPEVAINDSELQNDAQEDSRQLGAYIEVANRVLLRTMNAHPPNRAKAWQRQAGLFVFNDYEPGVRGGRWGSIAFIMLHQPEEGTDYCAAKCWAPTWREAIELALAKVLTI